MESIKSYYSIRSGNLPFSGVFGKMKLRCTRNNIIRAFRNFARISSRCIISVTASNGHRWKYNIIITSIRDYRKTRETLTRPLVAFVACREPIAEDHWPRRYRKIRWSRRVVSYRSIRQTSTVSNDSRLGSPVVKGSSNRNGNRSCAYLATPCALLVVTLTMALLPPVP